MYPGPHHDRRNARFTAQRRRAWGPLFGGTITAFVVAVSAYFMLTAPPRPRVASPPTVSTVQSRPIVPIQGSASQIEALINGENLRKMVYFLADDRFRGRGTGEGHLEGPISEYIESIWSSAGVTPFGDSSQSFRQQFTVRRWDHMASRIRNDYVKQFGTALNERGVAFSKDGKVASVVSVQDLSRLSQERLTTHNLVGLIEGSDPVLKHEYVVIGAHLDHLGATHDDHGGDGIYNGADDNGSGSAAVIEIGRVLGEAKRQGFAPKRSIIVILFSGEELGLLGSQHWVTRAPVKVEQIKGMVNLDMVGRLSASQISVLYGETNGNSPFESLANINGLGFTSISRDIGDILERSDHFPFYEAGIPVVGLFEGYESGRRMNPDYHTRGDHAEKVDYGKLLDVTRLAHRFVYGAAVQ